MWILVIIYIKAHKKTIKQNIRTTKKSKQNTTIYTNNKVQLNFAKPQWKPQNWTSQSSLQEHIHFCIKKISLADTSTTIYWFFFFLKLKHILPSKLNNSIKLIWKASNQTVKSAYSLVENIGDYFYKTTLFKYCREKNGQAFS